MLSFIFNSRIIASGTPKELIEQEGVNNLEDVFIKYVERESNEKIESSFEDIKFALGEEQ